MATLKFSVDRYNPVVLNELCSQARGMYDPAVNPMTKPTYVGACFGKFTVEMVSEEAKDLLNRD